MILFSKQLNKFTIALNLLVWPRQTKKSLGFSWSGNYKLQKIFDNFKNKTRNINNKTNNTTDETQTVILHWLPKIGPTIKKETQKFGFTWFEFQADPNL